MHQHPPSFPYDRDYAEAWEHQQAYKNVVGTPAWQEELARKIEAGLTPAGYDDVTGEPYYETGR